MQTGQLLHRTSLFLKGSDTEHFLDRVLTANIEAAVGESLAPAALLSPQGKIQAAFLWTRLESGILLDVPLFLFDDLKKRLSLLKLRSDVQLVENVGAVHIVEDGGLSDARHGDAPQRAYRADTDNQQNADWNDKRIALALPEIGLDYAPNSVFPTDVNLDLLGGLDYKKGCFVGQEVVSRMKRRGTIRRRTLILAGQALVKGERLYVNGMEVGQISSVNSAGSQGLGIMRLDRLGAETAVQTEKGAHITIHWPKYLAVERPSYDG